ELVPAAHRLLDEYLADRGLRETALDVSVQLLVGRGEAAAVSSERERGSNDARCGQPRQLLDARDDRGRRNLQSARLDRLLEEEPVLRALDRVETRADQLDAELVEDAFVRELARKVECRLATHRGQERVGTLETQDVRHRLGVERLEVRPVGEAG